MTTETTGDRVPVQAGTIWTLVLGGGALGAGLGFGLPPLADWVAGWLTDLPLPLDLATRMPYGWVVPILTLVGLGVGGLLAAETRKECAELIVTDDGIVVEVNGTERFVPRAVIAGVLTDPRDLVILRPDGSEASRAKASELSAERLAEVLVRHDHHWLGTRDPNEDRFRRWVDGHPDLDDVAHRLLRRRRDALSADRHVEAVTFADRLCDHGVVVRDRRGGQQYRRVSAA